MGHSRFDLEYNGGGTVQDREDETTEGGLSSMNQESRTGTATETPSTAGTATTAPSAPSATASTSSAMSPRTTRKLSARRRQEVVAVLLFSGGPIFESSIPLSVFGIDRQDAGVPRYRLLVAAGEDGPLRTTGGLELTAPYGLEALSRAGTVVVPAWRSISQPPPVEALDALRRAHEEGARIIGLCTGAFVLAAAGLLDGRPATTHWMYAPTLAKRYPSVHVDPRELFVDDGDVLTSAGTAAGIDLCLHVVRTDHGTEAANALARRLVVPPRRGSDWSGGQQRHLDRSLPEEIGGDPLAEVVAWALEHLHEQFDVETLAARAYMSRRTFDRRFRTLTGSAPLQGLITQRVLQAQRLLETSDYSVDEVAGRCGFRSPVALRGHFRRQLGSSPASYRAAYRARRPQDETEPVAVKEPRAAATPSALPVQPPAKALKAENDTFTTRIPEQPGRLRGDRDVRGRNAAVPGPRDRPVG
jgi:transcriptional regulator GlxA family with amidase domain